MMRPCRTYPVALLDSVRVAQDGRADQVGFEVEGQAEDVVPEVQELVGTHPLQTLNAGNTVANLDHGADVHQGQVAAKFFDLAL